MRVLSSDPKSRVVSLLEEVWGSLADLGETLVDADWGRSTDCPGWEVKDNYSHVIGTERMLMGESAPAAAEPYGAHVKNPIGAANEAWIAARRGASGPDILVELREVTSERLEMLRGMTADDLARVGWSPIGQVPYFTFMEVRAFDCWAHEQDVRRATCRPGHLNGPVAELSVDRVIDAMPYVLGKLVAPPDGTSVTWEVTGPVVREVTAVVEDGRAHLLLRPGEAPVATSPPVGRSPSQVEAAARITCDTEVFCCLGLGRGEPLGYLEAGRVHITGDEELGRRVVTSMGFMI